MDTGYEEKIYRQVDKNLSDNLNDEWYVPINMPDRSAYPERNNSANSALYKNEDIMGHKNDILYMDEKSFASSAPYGTSYKQKGNIIGSRAESQADFSDIQDNEEKPAMSRAEYIRLAREACLRQLYTMESTSGSHSYIGSDELNNPFSVRRKKDKVEKLFQEGRDEDVLSEELAAYKSLIIRTVCAIIIFMSIFLIDKFRVKVGNFSYETIRQYVTAFDQMEKIEEKIVSWLK